MSRVLVVDDSPVDRRLARRLIEKLGDMEVFYAPDDRANVTTPTTATTGSTAGERRASTLW